VIAYANRYRQHLVPSTSVPQSYTWTFPGAPVRVRIQLDVIRRLQDFLPGSAGCIGLLLGRVAPGHETEITSVCPVAGDGPDAVAVALKSLRTPDHAVPIGFYRAGAAGLRLNDEDYEIARTCFANPASVFLVVQHSDRGPGNATFFFWDNHQIHRDFAILEFPFDAEVLARQESLRARAKHQSPERLPVAPIAASPAPRPVPAQRQPPPQRVSEHRGWRAVWLVLVCISVGALLAAGARFLKLDPWSPKAPPSSSANTAVAPSLGLKFHREGTDLAVTWDREAVVKYGATAGLLTVRDGPNEKAIGLNADLLRSANVLISTVSDQVQIQLTLLQPNQTTLSESGIAVLPARGSPDPTVRAVPTVPRPVAAEQVASAPWQLPQKSFTPPSGPAAPDPPRIEEPPVNPALSMPRSPSNQPSALPAVLANPALRPAAPPPPAQSQPPANSAAAPTEIGSIVNPAQFLSGGKPEFPTAAHNARVQGLVVVEATVGPDGKVRNARIISGHPLLRDAALRAVRGWTFKPATINGIPVEAPTRAEVNFRGVW
jgi:periplasmic protein TonB